MDAPNGAEVERNQSNFCALFGERVSAPEKWCPNPHIEGMSQPVIARPRRAAPVLVCRKCLKRSSEGKNIRRELKRELKQQRDGNLKAPRLIATSCFGICPKKAVTLASGKSLLNGEYVLVSDAADVGDALKLLQPAS